MSLRSFTYLTRALIITVLCGALITGVFAADREDRGNGRDRRDSARHEARGNNDKGQRTDSPGAVTNAPNTPSSHDSGRWDNRGQKDNPGDKRGPQPGNSRDRWPSPATGDWRSRDAHPSPATGDWRNSDNRPANPPSDDRQDRDNRTANPPSNDWRNRDNRPANPPSDDWRNRDNRPANPPSDSWRNRESRPRREEGRDHDYYMRRLPVPPVRHDVEPYFRPTPRPTSHHYNYWVFNRDPGSRRSAYFHYGYFPYMRTTRIHSGPYFSIGFRLGHIFISGRWNLTKSNVGLDDALADIRNSWVDGRYDLIERHIDRNNTVAVLLDGKYDYSIEGSDYADMTMDALDNIQTISFTWQDVRERTDGNYTAWGRHEFYDDRGDRQTVYVSYTLRKIGRDWVIREVDSSVSSLI